MATLKTLPPGVTSQGLINGKHQYSDAAGNVYAANEYNLGASGNSDPLKNYYVDYSLISSPTAPVANPVNGNTPGSTTPASLGLSNLIPGETEAEKAARLATETENARLRDDAAPETEDDRRARITASFQQEIDALNGVYALQKQEAVQRGLGNLGSDAAIQNRRGLIGSSFGEAQTKTVESENARELAKVDTAKAAALSAVYARINAEVTQSRKDKKAAQAASAAANIAYLNSIPARQQKTADTAIKNILSAKLDIGDKDIEEMATLIGIDPAKFKEAYFAAKKLETDTAEAATSKALKEKADLTAPKGVGDYTFVFNPETEKWESKGSNKAATGTGVSGSTDPTVMAWAKRIYDGAAKITDIPASQAGLRNAVTKALADAGNDLTGRPTVTELGLAAKSSAEDLLKKFTDRKGTGAVGKTAMFNIATIPGTERADFINTFNSLKSQLALEGTKYLKGQGQVSDAERAILNQAVTKLSLSQTEDEFKKTLQSVIDKLSGTPEGSTGVLTSPDGTGQVDVSSLTPEQVAEAKAAGWK